MPPTNHEPTSLPLVRDDVRIEAIDLFCGAGGLSYGLRQAGIRVLAGVDIDPACRYPYEENNQSEFILEDARELTGENLARRFTPGSLRLLAGCAPCQPFSTLSNGRNIKGDHKWLLLDEFERLVRELLPDFVTMENVPKVKGYEPYQKFVKTLGELGYHVDARSIRCADYGIPQERRRFVLVASRLGPISLPKPDPKEMNKTVKEAIGSLPRLKAGETDPFDRLHKARRLTPLNLQRMRASTPGGTWEDWPEELRSPCHRRKTGASFRSVYARMRWDQPSPTITTQCYNFGTGRFGHPEQDRSLTLREAAILQSFPAKYTFARPNEPIHFSTIGRLIGNAVPPRLGELVGETIKEHLRPQH